MHARLETLIRESRCAYKGMHARPEDAAEPRWLEKPVLRRRLVDDMESLEAFAFSTQGRMTLSRDRCVAGEHALCTEFPTSLERKNPTNRAYDQAMVYRRIPGEDWREYNRLSLWIYVDAPGFVSMHFCISLHNEGERLYPIPGRFEGTHCPCLTPGRWHHVVWEIPYAYRDRVVGVSFGPLMFGSPADCADTVRVYYDQLEIQTVEPEPYRGWELGDRIAFCHAGYLPGSRKLAWIQDIPGERFAVLRAEDGRPAFQGPVEWVQTPVGRFGRMDFTALEAPGKYRLEVGERRTKPFVVGPEAYASAMWKTVNFYFQERCGYDVPGVHIPCHLDMLCRHPDGRMAPVAGGWHDAGDVTQGMDNTSEVMQALCEAAMALREREPLLAERMLEEARWGLVWMLRTRFGDGFRHTGIGMSLWTKNILGDKDDIVVDAENDPLQNYMAAAAEAVAARAFRGVDDNLAAWAARCAVEDYAFADGRRHLKRPPYVRKPVSELRFMSQALLSSAELYALTGEEAYREEGTAFARVVMACQQREDTAWETPMRGFFYESRERERIAYYDHRSYEMLPIMGLARMLETCPDHADAPLWRESLAHYAAYTRACAAYMEPYGILPGAIYQVDHANLDTVHRERSKEAGSFTLEDFNRQVQNGIRLDEGVYLRRFPVAYQFRGFFGTLLGKAKAVSAAARALGDTGLMRLAARQPEWIFGGNPFAMSCMYGEGYDYPPLYVAFSDQIVGALPVGIETYEDEDEPFFPMQNAATYKEIWVHPGARLLWLWADLAAAGLEEDRE